MSVLLLFQVNPGVVAAARNLKLYVCSLTWLPHRYQLIIILFWCVWSACYNLPFMFSFPIFDFWVLWQYITLCMWLVSVTYTYFPRPCAVWDFCVLCSFFVKWQHIFVDRVYYCLTIYVYFRMYILAYFISLLHIHNIVCNSTLYQLS